MLLPSIGILKSQRKNGEKKRTLIFRKKNQLFKKKKKFIHPYQRNSHVQPCQEATARNYKTASLFNFSLSLSPHLSTLSFTFSLKKFSRFLTLSQKTHLQKQKIVPSRKWFSLPQEHTDSFPISQIFTIQFKKRVQRFSPENLIPLSLSLTLPECSKLSLKRKWSSNN